MLKVEEKYLLQ